MSRDQGPYTRNGGRKVDTHAIPTRTRWYHRGTVKDSTALWSWLALTVFFASLALSAGIFLGA
jgi:hypothetical protein